MRRAPPPAVPALCAAAAAATTPVSFEPPLLIGEAMGPAYFVGIDGAAGGRVVAGPLGADVYTTPAGGGAGWSARPKAGLPLGQTFPSHCPSPCTSVATFGSFTPQLSGAQTATAFNATGGTRFSIGAGGALRADPAGARAVFRGLPRPVRSGKFSKGGIRLGGSASVRTADGGLLQTAIVTFAGQEHLKYPEATSVVAFRSSDGGAVWDFSAVVADAADYPFSEEGPNEMDLAVLPDGSTVFAAIRMDGGDGPATHPYVNYYQAASSDNGATWSRATPISGAGCARPRLLRVGDALLMSGGRMRNAHTSDILLWVSTNASSPSSSGWEMYSVSHQHNLRVAQRYNETLAFGPEVNSTSFSPRETNSYTSLVRIDARRAMITYDMHKRIEVPGRNSSKLVCTGWPTPDESKEGCEEGGDAKHDGHRYFYNTGRGTPAAVCGEAAHCWCCRTEGPDVDFEASFSMVFALGGAE